MRSLFYEIVNMPITTHTDSSKIFTRFGQEVVGNVQRFIPSMGKILRPSIATWRSDASKSDIVALLLASLRPSIGMAIRVAILSTFGELFKRATQAEAGDLEASNTPVIMSPATLFARASPDWPPPRWQYWPGSQWHRSCPVLYPELVKRRPKN